jgi:hypothetical protein
MCRPPYFGWPSTAGRHVVTAADERLLGASDQQHMERATALGRVVLTADEDFFVIVRDRFARNVSFPGLMFLKPNTDVGRAIRAMDRFRAGPSPKQAGVMYSDRASGRFRTRGVGPPRRFRALGTRRGNLDRWPRRRRRRRRTRSSGRQATAGRCMSCSRRKGRRKCRLSMIRLSIAIDR